MIFLLKGETKTAKKTISILNTIKQIVWKQKKEKGMNKHQLSLISEGNGEIFITHKHLLQLQAY